MSQKKLLIVILIVAVVSMVVVGLVIALTASSRHDNYRYVYEPPPFATANEIGKQIRIAVPLEAKNIRFAEWTQSPGHEEYLRFEAPVSVCLRHAETLAPGEAIVPVMPYHLFDDTRSIPQGIFRDLSWFDLRMAKNVVRATMSDLPRTQVWIDQEKGVFYYRVTD